MSKSIQLHNNYNSIKKVVINSSANVVSLRINKDWLKQIICKAFFVVAIIVYALLLLSSYNLNQMYFEKLLLAGCIFLFAWIIKMNDKEQLKLKNHDNN